MGAIGYADDLVLLCPSAKGLNIMINGAAKFAQEFSLMFNSKKSFGIKFSKNRTLYQGKDILIDNNVLQWKLSVKYLGTILTNNLENSHDIMDKCGAFNNSVNGIISRFKNTTKHVKAKLISKYSYSFYGGQNWDLSDENIRPITIQWNKMVRRVYMLPYRCHTNILPIVIGHKSPQVMLAQRFLNHMKNMLLSSNPIIYYVAACADKYKQGQLGKNLKNVYFKYFAESNLECDLNILSKSKHLIKDDVNASLGNFVCELVDIRDSALLLENFSTDEVNELLEYVTCA